MIKRTTLVLLTLAGLAAIVVLSRTAWFDYRALQVAERTAAKTQVEAMMGDATISLSLERSITQLGLGLVEPLSPDLRAMLDGQREHVDGLFAEVLATAEGHGAAVGNRFPTALRAELSKIEVLRTQADSELAVGKGDRTPGVPKTLPDTFKRTIIATQGVVGQLLEPGIVVPSDIARSLTMQRHAWAIREYGGRERTYMAIATAT
ncbi:MAG: hypothetical protein AAFX39_08960, partial [Pseudomonadota bacterium]